MNVDNMRDKLSDFCIDSKGCSELCPLYNLRSCRFDKLSDMEIIGAYKRVFGDEENRTYIDELKPENVIRHEDICKELNELYIRKNKDYGDSFHLSYLEEGMAAPRLRIGDKFNRFKRISRGEERMVKDETLRDTMIDLANYSIMTVMEIDRERESYEQD